MSKTEVTKGQFAAFVDATGYRTDAEKNTGGADGYWFTAPVQNYRPNDFGLYDMHGNVFEWVQDCWHDSYRNAPTDGRAWESACSAAAPGTLTRTTCVRLSASGVAPLSETTVSGFA